VSVFSGQHQDLASIKCQLVLYKFNKDNVNLLENIKPPEPDEEDELSFDKSPNL